MQTGDLLKHENAVHLKEKPHQCSYCDKMFALTHSLQRHEKAVHLKEKPHQCSFCDQRFAQSSNLGTHEKAVHLKEKPHQCSFCDDKFSTRQEVSNHEEAIHLKETPFRCTRCRQTFFRSPGYLLRHVREKHLDIQPTVVLHRLQFIDRSSSRVADITDVVDMRFNIGSTARAAQL